MAELPEIAKLCAQMRDMLRGKKVSDMELSQEKCLNVPAGEFVSRVVGASLADVTYRGKWIISRLNNGENILLSLGMGADVLYFPKDGEVPEKRQIKVDFADGSGYSIRFWWFGKYLLASDEQLPTEPNTKDIAVDPYDERFTPEHLARIMSGKKTQIKTFLMDQKNIGGIGNMYMHDILFRAKLHPKRKISDMNASDIDVLYTAITGVLNLARERGAFSYESDFFGQKGEFGMDDFLVGYKEDKPCPVCGCNITLIKTGSTSSYICPICQPL